MGIIPHIKRRSLIKNIKKLKQKMTYRHINTFILTTYTFMIPLLRLWAYSQAKPQFIFKFKSDIKKRVIFLIRFFLFKSHDFIY